MQFLDHDDPMSSAAAESRSCNFSDIPGCVPVGTCIKSRSVRAAIQLEMITISLALAARRNVRANSIFCPKATGTTASAQFAAMDDVTEVGTLKER